MLRKLYLAGLGVIVLTFSSCGGSQHAPTEKYFLVAANVKLPYWQQVNAGLNKAAAQLGVKAEMVGPESYDVKGQREQFADVLKQKPSGILVAATDPSLRADIDAAMDQGIPVITLDSDAPGSKRYTFIGTDNYKAGVLGGQLAARKLKFRGPVVVFTMPSQYNLKERLRGYTDVFETYPQMKISEVIDTQGDPRVVFDRTMEMIDKGVRVDAFICLVSFAGPEVAEVLARKKVTDKVIVAMDTDDRTLDGIQKGTILATIGQKPFTMAFFGLKMLDDLYHHPPASHNVDWVNDSFSPVPNFVDTGASVIDSGNVEHYLNERNSTVKKPT